MLHNYTSVVEKKLDERRRALGDRRLTISRTKALCLRFNGGGNSDINLQEEDLIDDVTRNRLGCGDNP